MTVDGDQKLAHRPFAELAGGLKQLMRRLRKRAQQTAASAPAVSPPSGSTPAPPQRPVDEDKLFWREMEDVRPLSGRENYVPSGGTRRSPPPPTGEEAEVMAQLADLVQGRAAFDFSLSDEHIEGIAVGLDRRLLRRLQKGQFAVQGFVDLHGKTRQEARELVEAFLVHSRRQGHRCVLIVHGRGLNSKDQIPVLKESLRVWLTRGRMGRWVLAFCSARPVDGGAGAVYVLLRR